MALRTSLAEIIQRPITQVSPSRGTATGRLERYGSELFNEFRGTSRRAEEALIEDAGVRSNEDVTRIGGEASDLVSRAFTTSRGTLERQRRALGHTQTAREKASQNRRFGLAQVLSDVDARNRALLRDQERREQLRLNAGGLRDIIDQAALSGLSSAAGAETGRRIRYEDEMAQYEAEKDAALGNLVGVGLSFVPGLGAAGAVA